MVIVFPEYEALTPGGKPVEDEIAVTPVVECVIAVRGELTQTVGELEAAPTVRFAVTVISILVV
jgi:hypothetical protein